MATQQAPLDRLAGYRAKNPSAAICGPVAGRSINLHRGAIDGDGDAPAALTGGSRA